LLDTFTTWGTQLFYPFDIRLSLHSIFVIDPLYTLPFLFCMIMVMRFERKSPKRVWWCNLGLIISSLYLFFTVFTQQIVKTKFENRLKAENIDYIRKIVKPSPMNIILWNAVIETESGYFLGDYSFFDTQPISFSFYPKNKDLISDIENEKIINQLKWISEDWFLITQNEDKLFFNDIRFGTMNSDKKQPEFSFSYKLIKENNTVQAIEVNNKSKQRAEALLSNLWERVKGN